MSLTGLVYALLLHPLTREQLETSVLTYANVSREAIARAVCEMLSARLIEYSGRYLQRSPRPVLTLGSTYHWCACNRRRLPVEYKRCACCAREEA